MRRHTKKSLSRAIRKDRPRHIHVAVHIIRLLDDLVYHTIHLKTILGSLVLTLILTAYFKHIMHHRVITRESFDSGARPGFAYVELVRKPVSPCYGSGG